MKIRILSLAFDDLQAGRDFYEQQQAGLGAYFLDTLFSDIESLLLYAGVHIRLLGYFRALSNGFRLRSITRSTARASKYGESWIAAKIRNEPNRSCAKTNDPVDQAGSISVDFRCHGNSIRIWNL